MHMPWGISCYDFHPRGHYLLVKCLDIEQSASMARNAALVNRTWALKIPAGQKGWLGEFSSEISGLVVKDAMGGFHSEPMQDASSPWLLRGSSVNSFPVRVCLQRIKSIKTMAVIRASAYLTAGSTDGPLCQNEIDWRSLQTSTFSSKKMWACWSLTYIILCKSFFFFFWAFHSFCHVLLQTLWHLPASTRLLDTMLFLAVT